MLSVGVIGLSAAVALGFMQVAHAESVPATSLTGTLKTAAGTPIADTVLTISVDTESGGVVTPVEVGWGYSWSDGSFDSWIGFPETIAAETDSDGEFPVDITIPGDTGAPTAVYSGLAKVGADDAIRPYDETTDILGSFNLRLVQYTDGSDTEVPATASVGLTPIITRLATDHAGATIEHAGETVGVSLQSGQTTPTAADANSTTFENVSTATDAEIRSVPGGAQLLSVMQSPSASSTQRYNVDLPTGVTLSELEDGGYLMVDETGESVGRIDAPWAKDASGQSLATEYTLQGNVLTQTTNTAGAVFPVVADPKISFGLRIYVRYSRAEVREFKARNALVAATTLMGVACGKIPIGWLKVGCLASVAMASSSVLGTFKDAANRDRCVELKFNYQAILMEWSSRARGSWCD